MFLAKFLAIFLSQIDFIDSLFLCTTRNTIKLKRIYMKKDYNILSV